MLDHPFSKKLLAEFLGTMLLLVSLMGAVIFTLKFPDENNSIGIGLLGVSLALGFSVMIGIYAFGPISGGHFNPAVTMALAVAGKFSWRDVPLYMISQTLGAIFGMFIIVILTNGNPEVQQIARSANYGANGYGELSPLRFDLLTVAIAEVFFTAMFTLLILFLTNKSANSAFAPIAIGLSLTIFAFVAIPISNASFNPARSIAPAIFVGSETLSQLWVFIVFPLVGGAIAGLKYRFLFSYIDKTS